MESSSDAALTAPSPSLHPEPFTRALLELNALYLEAPIAIAFLDTSLRYVRVNELLAQMNGVAAWAHVGRTIPEVLPDVGETVNGHLQQVLRTGRSVTGVRVVGRTSAHGGRQREYDCNWHPVRDEGGQLIGITAIIEDVTERMTSVRARERAVREASAARARAEALQRVTAGLALADCEQAICRAVAAEALRLPHAVGCTLSLVDDPTERLQPVTWNDGCAADAADITHALRVPCVLGERATAVIELRFAGNMPFGEAEHALLEAMAAQCALALNRVQLRAAERAADARFRALVDQAPFAVHVIAPNGDTILVNRAFELIFGITAADVQQMDMRRELIPEEDGTRQLLQRSFAGEVTMRSPVRLPGFRRSDGTAPWIEGVAYPVKNEAGEIVEIVTLANDVTEREEAGAALREAEERSRLAVTLGETLRLLEEPDAIVRTAMERLRGIMQASHMVFLEASDDGELLQLVEDAVAPGYASMMTDAPCVPVASFGHDADLFRNGFPLMFADLHAEWRERGVPETMVHYAAGQGTAAGLWIPLQHRGRIVSAIGVLKSNPYSWSAHEIRFAEEQGTRLVEALMRSRATRALRQLTEELEQRVEERTLDLRSANARLADASARKSRFVNMMSHEIRTPLNAILGFNQLMHDGVLGPTTAHQQECLADILSCGQHLVRLVDDVLDVARLEAGRMTFRPEVVAIAPLLEECIALVRPMADASGVRLVLEQQPATAGSLITDAGRLRQVLLNYLSNGIKWTSDGGTVTLRVTGERDDHVRFSVADTGVGIEAIHLSRLFNEFERVDAGHKTIPGTGLGLVLTRRLVEAQGGTVGVTSEVGAGSCFWAEFPVQMAASR